MQNENKLFSLAVFKKILHTLSCINYPTTAIHGDLTFNNIITYNDNVKVIDWTDCCYSYNIIDFIFLAEYSMMFLVGMIGVVLFLGGWNTPLPNIGSLSLANWTTGIGWGIFWILFKTLSVVAMQIWIRWTLPRFRVDQLMSFCWKVLTPLSFLCMLISGIWRLTMM